MLLPELSDVRKNDCIKALWRGAWRYHYASLQDKNPVVAARHNGYAVALTDALREIASEEEVKEATGGSLKKLHQEAIAFQDKIEESAIQLLKEIEKKGIHINLPDLSNPLTKIYPIFSLFSAVSSAVLLRAAIADESDLWKVVYAFLGAIQLFIAIAFAFI